MYIDLLTVASLCAVVLAGPQLKERENVDTSTISSSLEPLLTGVTPGITATSTSTTTTEFSQPTITAPVTGLINGTTATLVPVGTGGLTIAGTGVTGGNSTVMTGKLTSSTKAGETETGTKTSDRSTGATSAVTGNSTPSPISSSSKAGAGAGMAQITGVVGAGVVGLVGLIWVL